MARFLHIADVHLGIKRYNLPDRTTDFFRAWREVLERHAIAAQVDFVVIAGDMFDQRRVDPQAANHAMIMLRELERAGIPALVIEGNHDQRESASKFSWLRSFSQWGFIKLLEPYYEDQGRVRLEPWDDEHRRGSYIDIGDARVFGSTWYGTTVGQTLPLLGKAIQEKRREGAANILMLHSDIEGQLNRPIHSALSISRLAEIRGAVDYLALGHTHKKFEIDGWAFNPGSLEACNVDEAATPRGAYLVETDGPRVKASFLKAGADFFQRPFVRREIVLSGHEEPDEIREAIFAAVREECPRPGDREQQGEDERPIIEVTLKGQIGFRNSLLRLDKIKEQAVDEIDPLGLIISNKTVPRQLAVAVDIGRDAPRTEREAKVIEDLIKPDPRLAPRAAELAAMVVEMKRLALDKEAPDKMFKFLERCLFGADEKSGSQPRPLPSIEAESEYATTAIAGSADLNSQPCLPGSEVKV